MSLAVLNQPAAIAAAGTGALILLPFAEHLVSHGVFSFAQLKAAAAAAYVIQVVAVSIPGRIDGEVAKAIQDEKKGGMDISATTTDEGKKLAPRNGRTLVAPSGWA